jgi:hypothetical protein
MESAWNYGRIDHRGQTQRAFSQATRTLPVSFIMPTVLPLDEDLARFLINRAKQEAIRPEILANRLIRQGLGLSESSAAPASGPFRQQTFSMGAPRVTTEKMLQFAEEEADEAFIAKLGRAS